MAGGLSGKTAQLYERGDELAAFEPIHRKHRVSPRKWKREHHMAAGIAIGVTMAGMVTAIRRPESISIQPPADYENIPVIKGVEGESGLNLTIGPKQTSSFTRVCRSAVLSSRDSVAGLIEDLTEKFGAKRRKTARF